MRKLFDDLWVGAIVPAVAAGLLTVMTIAVVVVSAWLLGVSWSDISGLLQ